MNKTFTDKLLEKVLSKLWALSELPRFIKDFYKADVSWYGNLPEGTTRLSLREVFEIWKVIWWED